MKRISDKGKIPEFFNNKRYDEYYKNCGVVKLTHEIQDRQNTSYHINCIFKDDYITPITDDDLKDEKYITVKCFKTIDGKRVEYTPPPRTIEQIINDSKASYLRWIEGRTEVGFLEHPQLGRVPNMKRSLEILPRILWDTRPYIQPIKEMADDREIRTKYAFRGNVDAYDEYPAISINLDFSSKISPLDVCLKFILCNSPFL